ncbi:MAG: metallophosphoesterase [Clostridia bacterium]|nr:metallophosphoesterase [Clostridia bacterium]
MQIERFYPVWGVCRQAAARLGLCCERLLFRFSGGRAPKALFTLRADPQPVGTDVRILNETAVCTEIAKCGPDGQPTDAPFVIVSSTDFHFDTDAEKNYRTAAAFVRHIREVKPDLVVLTGDVILSKYQQVDAIKFADMMETLGVYWTAVFGNHEVREVRGFYKWLLLKSFADHPHCLCKYGPEELFGYGNYMINIRGAGGKLRKSLFFFDSGRDLLPELNAAYGLPPGTQGYDCLKREQIEFYRTETAKLRAQEGDCRFFLYFHIPLKEYEAIFEPDGAGGWRPTGAGTLLCGEQHESVGSSPCNSGMFQAMRECGGQAVFCGHDHINDWCALYDGIYLVYNLPGNYNSYHLGTNCGFPEEKWVQGVTVTALQADGSIAITQRYNRIFLEEAKK